MIASAPRCVNCNLCNQCRVNDSIIKQSVSDALDRKRVNGVENHVEFLVYVFKTYRLLKNYVSDAVKGMPVQTKFIIDRDHIIGSMNDTNLRTTMHSYDVALHVTNAIAMIFIHGGLFVTIETREKRKVYMLEVKTFL